MTKAIKLSISLITNAENHGKAHHRSTPKQIEYWARIGLIAEENPDLALGFVRDILVALEDDKAGMATEYKFG